MSDLKIIITTFLFIIFCVSGSSAEKGTAISSGMEIIDEDFVILKSDSLSRFTKLTDEDYAKTANELGVEVAVIKAVIDIEAGKAHKGFASPGVPVINFDRTMFTILLHKAGISTKKYSGNTAFKKVNVAKYGNYSAAQWARLKAGRKISSSIANQATFWGMFQIGGFNWKKCGCSSIDDFVKKMCFSENMQLQLFADFIVNSNMLKYLKAKDWRGFSRAYNGPNYAKKGYHTRMASAYRKYANQ